MSRHALVIGIDSYPGFGPEAQLAGAARDARMMAEVLIEGYGFAACDVDRLLDSQATRVAVLDALAALRRRVRANDQVILFYSGHGSQMTDREGDEGDGLDETLVPYDSGRGAAENRDVTDDEINHWASRVLEVTLNLTMIFDCCHSATLHRPGWRVKSVPADLRPVEALPPSPMLGWRDVETGPRPLKLAACRDDELAHELPPSIAGEVRGAFSFYLVAALREASSQETWREIFERATAKLAAGDTPQHPEVEGDGLDLPVFAGVRSTLRGLEVGRRLVGLADRPDRFRLAMTLFRSRGGPWIEATGREPLFVTGDRLRVDVRHGCGRELFVYLLDIGLTGAVSLLFPGIDGHEALDAGTVLTVGDRSGDRLTLSMPEDLPSGTSDGVGKILLIAAPSRWSTSRLLSGSVDFEGAISDPPAALTHPYRLF